MPGQAGQERLGLLVIAASAVAFSTAGFFTRLIDLDVWTVLFWRGCWGGFAIAAYIVAVDRHRFVDATRTAGPAGVLVALCSSLATIFFIHALRLTTVADVMVINATSPFITAALAWLFISERASKVTIVASVVALAGVVVMVNGALATGHLVGNLLALIMTFLISAMMVIIRVNHRVSMLPSACLSAFLSALLVLPIATPAAAQGGDMIYLLLFGVLQFGLGLLLLTVGTRLIPAARAALVGSLDVPLGPLWVWIAFGEQPTLPTWIGGVIVMTAVIAEILLKRPND